MPCIFGLQSDDSPVRLTMFFKPSEGKRFRCCRENPETAGRFAVAAIPEPSRANELLKLADYSHPLDRVKGSRADAHTRE
jgi:hypothetical protein